MPQPIWKDTRHSFEDRAKDLIARMTLEEKVSQMTFNASALSRFSIMEYNWWNECLHGVARAGVATVFPQAIGMAASFDDELMHKVATAISDEARAKHHEFKRQGDFGIYKGLTMWSPNVNIFRDPRWGRGHETYGEDPYLASRMGVAFCRGLQGDDKTYLKTVATPKHFAVHSGPEADRHHFDAKASIKDMKETYLPAFKACVQDGQAYSVMGAYNRTNGEACCASEALLQDILRDQWGFDGYVVSDCGAIEDIHDHHKLTKTPAQSAALAVNNGCDLNCGYIFPHLLNAVKEGLISEDTIDKSLYRLFMARFKLGMFDPDKRVPYAQIPFEVNDCAKHHALSKKMAKESLVLLKNDGILPVSRKETKTIAIIGPVGDNRDALIGNYYGTPSIAYTIADGFRAAHPDVRLLIAEGCGITHSPNNEWGDRDYRGFSEAKAMAQRADLVILALGMTAEIEGEEAEATEEGGDRESITMCGVQQELLETITALKKPTVLLNLTGSCVDLCTADARCNAILQCWYPGQFGGLVAAEAVFGDFSPSGRLPITFYREMSDLPPFEDYSMANRTYKYFEGTPLYPFGYGLSYTKLEYYCPMLERGEITCGEDMHVSVIVHNLGEYATDEVVQVYLCDDESRSPRPRWKLVAFKRVHLAIREEKTVQLTVKARDMALVQEDGTEVIEPGTFTLYIGSGQPDTVTRELIKRESLSARYMATGDAVIID